MNKKVQFFFDTETTGLDAWRNGMTQIACIILHNGKEVERFEAKINVFPNDLIDGAALQVTGENEAMIASYPAPGIVYPEVVKLFKRYVDPFNKHDKMFAYAYNASFDHQVLRCWMQKNGDKFFGSYFWMPVIDVMALAGEHLIESRPEMANFKQETVARAMGIEVDESRLHEALYDVELCVEIYRKVKNNA